ncbi:MAG: response regulator transcription factor [Acidobacteriota bacterium]
MSTDVRSRVLLIEDDHALARGLADNLRDEGYEVRLVTRGDEAVAAKEDFRPDVLVLDIMLPGRSGLDVLEELRAKESPIPILMLTAKGEIVDRVVGLELGADDYLSKPFAIRELLARVRALLRRGPRPGPTHVDADVVTIGRVRFDFRAWSATRADGRLVELSTHDMIVLRMLARHRGEVVSRVDIVEEVCGMDSDSTLRTVDNHLVALRRAVGDDPRHPRWFHTVRGEGYRLARD